MKLRDWLQTSNITHDAFAEKLGVARETVTRWCSGAATPDWSAILKIEDETGKAVTAADWAETQRDRVRP